jgi:hypothetical protein
MAYWYRENGPNTPEEIMSTFMKLFRHGLARSDAEQASASEVGVR